MFSKVQFNIFAPDPEELAFNLNPENGPNEEERLRDQLRGFAESLGDFEIISVNPSYQGSFDVVIKGPEPTLNKVLEEYGFHPDGQDVIWIV
jgi:hypothetical protein